MPRHFKRLLRSIRVPRTSAPKALVQLRELHLDAPGRVALDTVHHVGQRQLRRDRQEHLHVIPRQDAVHDVDAKFGASLTDDLAQALTHLDFLSENGIR